MSVSDESLAEHIGREGTFVGYIEDTGEFEEPVNCRVQWDGLSMLGHCENTKHLAPAIPERNQTIPWSECLWQPTKETA